MGLFTSNSTFASVIQDIISLINLCVGVLAALALVVFFYGLVKYIYHSDDAHAREEGRKSIMWGLIGLFVLFSLWGILQLLNIAFFGGGSINGSYSTGESYYSGGNAQPDFSQDFGGGAPNTPTPSGRLPLIPQ